MPLMAEEDTVAHLLEISIRQISSSISTCSSYLLVYFVCLAQIVSYLLVYSNARRRKSLTSATWTHFYT